MNKFVIITPCSRPQNLSLIYESILNAFEQDSRRFVWVIVHDTDEHIPVIFHDDKRVLIMKHKTTNGKSGNEQRNKALDYIIYGINFIDVKSFVYFLDDDNIMHPNFSKVVDSFVSKETKMITFESKTSNNILWVAATSTPMVGNIDSGSFVVRLDSIKNTRWQVDLYEADGVFAKDIFEKLQYNELTVAPEVAGYYNALR